MIVNNINFRKYSFIKILAIILCIGQLFFIICLIRSRGLFEYIGIDYRLRYSSGMIIRDEGIAEIYNYELQTSYQKTLYNKFAILSNDSMDFWTIPLPYLPVFCIPFLISSLVNPVSSFFIWQSLLLFLYAFYMYYFLKRNKVLEYWKIAVVFSISLPFFLNLIFGQVNLLLLISLGEFYTATKRNNYFVSGLWLTGMLLKPQMLIIIIPYLIFFKRLKVLKGFVLGSFVISIISYILIGNSGVIELYKTIKNWPVLLSDSGMNLLSLYNNMFKIFPAKLSVFLQLFLL